MKDKRMCYKKIFKKRKEKVFSFQFSSSLVQKNEKEGGSEFQKVGTSFSASLP